MPAIYPTRQPFYGGNPWQRSHTLPLTLANGSQRRLVQRKQIGAVAGARIAAVTGVGDRAVCERLELVRFHAGSAEGFRQGEGAAQIAQVGREAA